MRLMKAFRLTKPRHVLVIAFSIFLIACCILLMKSSKATGGSDGPLLLKTQFNSESDELLRVLRRASMEDRKVILTAIFDEAWTRPGSVLNLFLQSFQRGQGTKRLLNHLVIVTLGSAAFQHCNGLHPHCFQLKPFGSKKEPLVLDYLMLQRKTNNLLLQVLKLGYSFVFTEADVMWLRNPIANFHPEYEITIPCGSFSDDDSQNRSKNLGRGLFYVKSDEMSVELFQYWRVWGTLYPNSRVESLCEVLKEQQEMMEMLGMRIQYLDAAYFGGFCQGGSREISKVYTMQANCCDNVEYKVYDLKLVLEEINFRAKSLSTSAGNKAPKKCIA